MTTGLARATSISTAAVLIVAATAAARADAQTPARDRATTTVERSAGAIRGRVVAATTHDPIRNARVTASGERDLPPVLTDADGRFAIVGLAAGEFRVSAGKPGFSGAALGARAPGAAGRAIRLAAGQIVDGVAIELRRGAAISGAVIDAAGEPVVGASVMVERAGPTEGAVQPPRVGLTDDLGQYRIGSLPEGRVLVSIFAAARSIVMLPDGNGVSVSGPGNQVDRIYYPGGVRASQGEPITLQPGDDKRGIDFTIAAPRLGAARAQPSRDQTVIAGRVLTSDGRAIAGAQVVLAPVGSTAVPVRFDISDVDGMYRFTLPPRVGGTFRISAQRAGYLPGAYGQRGPADVGDDVDVDPRESKTNLDVTLLRASVIAGTLFDENGDPVEGAVIRAFSMQRVAGQPQLTGIRATVHPTDDLGRYRVAGLAAGEYLLGAFVGQITGTEVSVGLPGYATTFFPGTPNAAESQRVLVGTSQELSDINFSLVRIATARVSGQAFDASGDPITGGIALMPSRRSRAILPATFGARIERDGRFEFSNVAPGEYVLQAARHRQGAWNEGESATMFVTVTDGDVTDLELRTSPGSTMAGRIVADGGVVRAGEIELSAIPVDPDLAPQFGPPSRALIDGDLHFELGGLRGPRRLQVTRTPRGFALEAIRVNGIDVTDTPLPLGRPDQSLNDIEIVLTTHVTEISGVVSDARGHASDAAAIVVFPVDATQRYEHSRFIASVSADRQGRYRIEALPPGEYFIAAVDRRAMNVARAMDDGEFLESLVAGSARATLGEAAHITVAVRIAER